MDRRERLGDQQQALLVAMQGALAETWTSLVGIIQSFDATKQTAVVQPAVRARVQARDGSYSWEKLPLLLDCPVQFPRGGGLVLTFPVAEGDECLVVFADRCIDAWWQSGGLQNQAEIRMHDLSDGFVFLGFSSVPLVTPIISATAAELRTTDGNTKVSVAAAGNVRVQAAGNVQVQAGGSVTLQTGLAAFSLTPAGAISITAPTGFFINGVLYNAHRHDGVATGTGTSGGVVP